MEVDVPEEPRRASRGPLFAWIACAAWTAWWVYHDATSPPPTPFPAWLHEEFPYSDWEIPILVAGAILVALFAWSALRGRLRGRFKVSRSGADAFAAAAAVWLLAELGFYFATGWGVGEEWGLTLWMAMPIGVVAVALAWPVLSGVDGRRSQVALGLTRGAGIATETAVGLLAVPAILAINAAWFALVRPAPGRANPMDDWLYSGDAALTAYAMIATALQAPIVEECGFRGIIYRFLRDATGRLSPAAGIGASVLVNSLLFAVSHAYGWPALFPILIFGAAACLLREWRGSLIAPIALHSGLNGYYLVADLVDGRF